MEYFIHTVSLTSFVVPRSENCSVFVFRYVFWVDCCEPPYIGRIGMDGRGQTVITDTEIHNPTALTIDYTNKRLYWADDNHILFANMDGTQRRKGEFKCAMTKIAPVLKPRAAVGFISSLYRKTLHLVLSHAPKILTNY